MFWKKKSRRDREYYESRMRELWRDLVPPANEADTVQGELVRCIGNLEDESSRNGNANWDGGDEEAVEFLLDHLPDSSVFEAELCKRIRDDVNRIRAAGRSGHGDGESHEESFTVTEEFERVIQRVVDWCDAHKDLIRLREIGPEIRRFEK
jgi:hypothetical protein